MLLFCGRGFDWDRHSLYHHVFNHVFNYNGYARNIVFFDNTLCGRHCVCTSITFCCSFSSNFYRIIFCVGYFVHFITARFYGRTNHYPLTILIERSK